MGGKKEQTQTQSSEPWAPQQRHLQNIFNAAEQMYRNDQGPTPMSERTSMGLDAMANLAMNNPMTALGQNYMMQALGGGMPQMPPALMQQLMGGGGGGINSQLPDGYSTFGYTNAAPSFGFGGLGGLGGFGGMQGATPPMFPQQGPPPGPPMPQQPQMGPPAPNTQVGDQPSPWGARMGGLADGFLAARRR